MEFINETNITSLIDDIQFHDSIPNAISIFQEYANGFVFEGTKKLPMIFF